MTRPSDMDNIDIIVSDTHVITESNILAITEIMKKNANDEPERAHQLQIKIYEKFIRDVSDGDYTIQEMLSISKKILQLKRISFPRGY